MIPEYAKVDDVPFLIQSTPITQKEANELADFFDKLRMEKRKKIKRIVVNPINEQEYTLLTDILTKMGIKWQETVF